MPRGEMPSKQIAELYGLEEWQLVGAHCMTERTKDAYQLVIGPAWYLVMNDRGVTLPPRTEVNHATKD